MRVFPLLREATDTIIESLKDKGALFRDEPVNWGNLRCTDVSLIQDESGMRFLVKVEEASSDAVMFREYLADRIRRELLLDVEVRTEW